MISSLKGGGGGCITSYVKSSCMRDVLLQKTIEYCKLYLQNRIQCGVY